MPDQADDTQSVEQAIRTLITAAWTSVDLANKETLQPGFAQLVAIVKLCQTFDLVDIEIKVRGLLTKIDNVPRPKMKMERSAWN